MLLAAARRFAVLLGLTAAATVVLSLLFGVLADVAVLRAVSVGFYLVGSFLLIAGFFVGNRGPLRLKSDDPGGVAFWGSRVVRWATPDEREETINTSAIFVTLGLALIVLGVAADERFSLF